jgi:hypothetical protein
MAVQLLDGGFVYPTASLLELQESKRQFRLDRRQGQSPEGIDASPARGGST